MMIPVSLLEFSCIKLYQILRQEDGDYYNQAFITAFYLCLFIVVSAFCVLQIFF